MTELNRLPWPDDQSASLDPIAGWIRTVLVGAPATYVATAENYAVWKAENPEDCTKLKEFGKRLTIVIRVTRRAFYGIVVTGFSRILSGENRIPCGGSPGRGGAVKRQSGITRYARPAALIPFAS